MDEALQLVLSAERNRSAQEWRRFILDNIDKGGRRAQAIIRGVEPWRPKATLSRDGNVLADPLSLLDAEAR
eukprot:3554064-Pyramimonas_sp.AAC.1